MVNEKSIKQLSWSYDEEFGYNVGWSRVHSLGQRYFWIVFIMGYLQNLQKW